MESYISYPSWNGQLMQPILESQLASIPDQQLLQNDENDVFQCGTCKMVLPSIMDFMIHKRGHNLIMETNTNTEVVAVTQEPIDLASLNDNQIWLWSDNTDNFPQTISLPEQDIIIHEPDNALLADNTLEPQTNEQTIEMPNIEVVPGNVDTFTQPQDTSNKPFNFVCSFCSKEFGKQSDYQQHYRIHTGEKPFQCPVCGRTFAQKSNKKRHMATHKIWPNDLSKIIPPETNEQIGYNCPFCEQAFTSYFSLKAHLITHKDRKVFKCIQTHCDAMFYDEKSLLNHVTESHPVPSYRCHVCSLHVNSLDEFAEHQKTHTDYLKSPSSKPVEKYRCLVCKVYFRTPESLASHSATATHKHECHICKKNYTTARYLRRHLLGHNNTTTYPCETCGKTFQSESSWKYHKLIHNPVKQHYCTQCHRSFTRKDKLLRHALIHQPNKKLKCPFATYFGCTKEFHRKDKLKRHIMTHTKVPGEKRRSRKKIVQTKDKIEEKALGNEQVKTVELLVVPSDETWPDDIQITCLLQE